MSKIMDLMLTPTVRLYKPDMVPHLLRPPFRSRQVLLAPSFPCMGATQYRSMFGNSKGRDRADAMIEQFCL